jgi:hypothetical protein
MTSISQHGLLSLGDLQCGFALLSDTRIDNCEANAEAALLALRAVTLPINKPVL